MGKNSSVVTVLDFATGEVHIYRYSNTIEDVEQFIILKGHHLPDVQYMCTEELILKVHQSD